MNYRCDDRDKEYAAFRNSLIPEAEERAKQRLKVFGKAWNWRKGAEDKRFRWDYLTQFFHEEMNRLWAETIKSPSETDNAPTADISTG
jgi:hypothetical protein